MAKSQITSKMMQLFIYIYTKYIILLYDYKGNYIDDGSDYGNNDEEYGENNKGILFSRAKNLPF